MNSLSGSIFSDSAILMYKVQANRILFIKLLLKQLVEPDILYIGTVSGHIVL